MNRRDLLKLSFGALLGAGLWPGRLRSAENGQGESDWSFLVVKDLHFDNAECGPWFERVVVAMKASAPEAEFCLLCGDQANTGQANQLGPVREIFEACLDIPVYATPGNHDFTAEESRTAYDDIFPRQLNQIFEHRGWLFVGVDSSEGTKF